ncbi:hypothetical protein MA16_Dca005650 [Dendrobium catenatum]|uniref:Uncharacterized protein n=1 Tax=Dendrobium catenatum TaxID=906689 RepID=A0A2I0WQ91_9ASPA|nr:hypothetical protein MA16_Dca005650 [Dendrobium catenatum]
MESDWSTSSESRLNDKKYIKELEKELKNCSLEIGYLQDQLGLRSIEANCMGENVHSLELKLAGVGMLKDKLRLLTEELVQSDEKCLQLTQEIKSKDDDFKNYAMQMEELEAAISSAALESQCEIESLRLDMIDLEERCFQAESLNQQMVQDKAKMYELLKEYEIQLHESQDTISFLEMENNRLKIKLEVSERKFKGLHCKVEAHLYNCFKEISREELKEEKLKAKEEAEDLIQAMAELRYEITGMLEDECKRRASIEQASLRRIQDLEEQVYIF